MQQRNCTRVNLLRRADIVLCFLHFCCFLDFDYLVFTHFTSFDTCFVTKVQMANNCVFVTFSANQGIFPGQILAPYLAQHKSTTIVPILSPIF